MLKFCLLSFIISISQINALKGKKDLFDETQYKYMKLKNRVFKGSIADCDLMENGKITEKGLKKYEELSKLQIGTIITGGMLIEPNNQFPVPTLEKDEYIKELKKLTEIVHKNGVNSSSFTYKRFKYITRRNPSTYRFICRCHNKS